MLVELYGGPEDGRVIQVSDVDPYPLEFRVHILMDEPIKWGTVPWDPEPEACDFAIGIYAASAPTALCAQHAATLYVWQGVR